MLSGAGDDGAVLGVAESVGAGLVGAGVDGAGLDGAGLVGAGLVGAGLVGAGLVGAGVVGAGPGVDGTVGRGIVGWVGEVETGGVVVPGRTGAGSAGEAVSVVCGRYGPAVGAAASEDGEAAAASGGMVAGCEGSVAKFQPSRPGVVGEGEEDPARVGIESSRDEPGSLGPTATCSASGLRTVFVFTRTRRRLPSFVASMR